MSAGAVIKYAMTLDGAQYMQELRRTIAETKAAEQAIREESKAMGVIKVSSDDVRKATSAGTEETAKFGSEIGKAIIVTRSFNSAQAAFSQAMSGNFIGAMNSGTKSALGFKAAIGAIGGASLVAVAGVAALVAEVVWMASVLDKEASRAERLASAQKRAAEDLIDFRSKIDKAGGKDPESMAQKEDARIVSEGDAAAALRELEISKKVLDEKKRQYEEFTQWKTEKIFFGLDEAEKADMASAEKQFTEEAELAAKRISVVEEMLKKISDMRRNEWKTDVDLSGKATEARRAELEKQTADAKKAAEESAAAWQEMVDDAFADDEKMRAEKAAAAEKDNARLMELEKELADLKIQELERVAAASEKQAAKAQAIADSAKFDLLNPGEALRAEREKQQEAKREQNRINAKMSGNSVEARAARIAYDQAEMDAWVAADKAALDRNKADLARPPDDPLVTKMEEVKQEITKLSTALVGVG